MKRLLLLIVIVGLLAAACGASNDSSGSRGTGGATTTADSHTDHYPPPTVTDSEAGTGMGGHGMSGTEMPGMGDMEFDQMFIAGMIPHHQSAIDMAKMARKRAEHKEIKQLADDIISAQQREIDQMRYWYKQWYGTEDISEMDQGMMDFRMLCMMNGEKMMDE